MSRHRSADRARGGAARGGAADCRREGEGSGPRRTAEAGNQTAGITPSSSVVRAALGVSRAAGCGGVAECRPEATRLSALGSLILLPPLLAVPPDTVMSRNIGRRPPAAAPAAQAQDMPKPFWPALMPISVLPVSYAAIPGGYDQLQTKRSAVECYRKSNNFSVSLSVIIVLIQ